MVARTKKISKDVFISHSSKNANIAEFLKDFLIAMGVDDRKIFCSSIAGNGVTSRIPNEVRAALKTSCVDIIILSREFQNSSYCLNEAGIIWFKGKTEIIVAMPDVLAHEQIGFINGVNNKFYKINSKNFIYDFADAVQKRLGELNIFSFDKCNQELQKLLRELPIADNISNNTVDEKRIIDAKEKIVKQIKDYYDTCFNPEIFYHLFQRNVKISPVENKSGYIRVSTTTHMKVINLSNNSYEENIRTQFIKRSGGLKTYKIVKVQQDNNDKTKEMRLQDKESRKNNSNKESPYEYSGSACLTVEPHSISEIKYKTSYEIPIDCLFQCRILKIPCLTYSIYASFSDDFASVVGNDYMFRYFASTSPQNTNDDSFGNSNSIEDTYKRNINIQYEGGSRAGLYYAFTICKVPAESEV